jgi:hypothetical protein
MFDQQIKFLTLNNKIMIELSIEKMEMLSRVQGLFNVA